MRAFGLCSESQILFISLLTCPSRFCFSFKLCFTPILKILLHYFFPIYLFSFQFLISLYPRLNSKSSSFDLELVSPLTLYSTLQDTVVGLHMEVFRRWGPKLLQTRYQLSGIPCPHISSHC